MKTTLFILGMIFMGVTLYAQTSKKEYRKSFDKAGITEVVLSNRYGQIDVEQKKADKIDVTATISVTAKNKSKADEFIEYIHIEDVVSGGFLNVETTFGKDVFFKQLLSGLEINIVYKVVLPYGMKLRIINTEGNVFINNFEGDLAIDIKNGNFQLGKMKDGVLQILQSGGNFVVDDVNTLNGQFKDCNLKIEKVREAKLNLEKCTGNLATAAKLNITSQNGELDLGEIEEMSGTANSTKFEIQDIGNELSMTMRFGEINIRNIHTDFSLIQLRTNYTKVGLTFMEGAGYNLELKHNKSLKMDLPADFQLSQQPTSEKNVLVETGFIGNKKRTGKVDLEIRNGNLYIQ